MGHLNGSVTPLELSSVHMGTFLLVLIHPTTVWTTMPTYQPALSTYTTTPTDQEKHRMFPIDPHILRTQDTTSVSSCRRGTFREDVAARDGQQCVWTRLGMIYCDCSAPYTPQQYISNFTRHRGRGDNEDDVITDIDDIRNGILLNKAAHGILGENLAFLMTPNFAMDTTDVDHRCSHQTREDIQHTSFRSTVGPHPHEFVSGTLVQIAASPQSPPDILFDAIYASFILHHFGTKIVKDRIAKEWTDSLYPVTDKLAATSERIPAQHERQCETPSP
ncbi:hypothetical protein EDB83DRAFT_1111029 [Lactarius deliciosus]|nr:hypothetical protein EDB83DRAFT_1111029 [Lactarius deliciosus]